VDEEAKTQLPVGGGRWNGHVGLLSHFTLSL
jgi:hypothetical protein